MTWEGVIDNRGLIRAVRLTERNERVVRWDGLSGPTTDWGQANARLIVHAPEMLDVLERIVDIEDGTHRRRTENNPAIIRAECMEKPASTSLHAIWSGFFTWQIQSRTRRHITRPPAARKSARSETFGPVSPIWNPSLPCPPRPSLRREWLGSCGGSCGTCLGRDRNACLSTQSCDYPTSSSRFRNQTSFACPWYTRQCRSSTGTWIRLW